MIDEKSLRLGFFFGILLLMMFWEVLSPRRPLTNKRKERWLNNLGIIFFNSLLGFMIPVLPVGLAQLASQNGWGLFNNFTMSLWLEFVLSVVILDLVIYLQHVMFHAVPLLWRLHLVHHADLDYDTTTGLRFHPIEILISIVIKLCAVAVIGPSVGAVIAFEIILNGMAMFNHGNVGLPKTFDSFLRLFVVTQDMHRVHHSVIIRETNSNFGFNLSMWDRIFGTYRAQPAAGQLGMTIGLSQYRDPGQLTLPKLLILPFIANPGSYSLSKQGKELHIAKSSKT